ncbi:MAG TPA: GyrI-like domain-containing protein [Candidatus Kapabacteria bacterium]|nr:GyrI-like domain-containing protein [Candidatus Kapabacteria bacterium]
MNNEPAFRNKGAFKIVGIERYTSNGIPAIREAWAEFGKRSQEIKHTTGQAAYGIEDYSRDFDMNKGGFPKYYYIAGLEVDSLADIPVGMKSKEIPAADYAVFTYNGPIDGLPKFFGYIYAEWMPKSGYSMDPKLSLDFEYYPERVMDMNAAKIEIWVPVVKG